MSAVEKLRGMVDAERLRASALDLLDELGPDNLRQIGEALTELADGIDNARTYVEEWQGCEEREERADAGDEALTAIEAVCQLVDYDVGDVDLPDWLRAVLTAPTSEELINRPD